MAAVLDLKSRHTGRPNGRRAVQFRVPGTAKNLRRDRHTLYLGKVSAAQADIIRQHVDHLVTAAETRRTPPWETSEWVAAAGPRLHEQLVKFGLVIARDSEKTVPLGPFTDGYIRKRTDLKPRTVTNLKQARGLLVGFFKSERDLRTITRGEAKDWRRWLQTEKNLSRATIATHVKKARQFFADAVDRKFIAENPFKSVEAGKQSNEERMQYVPAADVLRVIDKCDDDEWKLLFALARFGGLRVPSETELLEWADVDWTAGRMTVRSPKTERHEGKESRQVPLFAELRPHLEAARASARPDARHVLSRLRNVNPRTRAQKLIERAGLKPWPKLFQNLRSSCQTDLTAKHPRHVACAWVGNTEDVAKRHYLQVTEADFDKATESAATSNAGTSGQEVTGAALPAKKQGNHGTPNNSITPKGGSTPPKTTRQNRTNLKTALAEALPNAVRAEQSVNSRKRLAPALAVVARARGGGRP